MIYFLVGTLFLLKCSLCLLAINVSQRLVSSHYAYLDSDGSKEWGKMACNAELVPGGVGIVIEAVIPFFVRIKVAPSIDTTGPAIPCPTTSMVCLRLPCPCNGLQNASATRNVDIFFPVFMWVSPNSRPIWHPEGDRSSVNNVNPSDHDARHFRRAGTRELLWVRL